MVNVSWEELKDALHVRFRPTQFEDFCGDLSKLKNKLEVLKNTNVNLKNYSVGWGSFPKRIRWEVL